MGVDIVTNISLKGSTKKLIVLLMTIYLFQANKH